MIFDVSFEESNQIMPVNFGEIQRVSDGGFERGYESGKQDGYTSGYQEGYSKGDSEGYDKGYDTGYEEGFASAPPDYMQYVTGFANLFQESQFPEDTDLNIDISNMRGATQYYFLNSTFRRIKGVKSIKILTKDKKLPLYLDYTFGGGVNLKTVDLSDNPLIYSWSGAFAYAYELEEIIGELDLSGFQSWSTKGFESTTKLKEMRFKKGTIPYSITFGSCWQLSPETIQSIIDGLADLTGQTAQTLDFYSDIVAKLTDEQQLQILSKNWTVI